MRIGIDASNIRAGGGLNHLIQILNHFNKNIFNIQKIFVWSTKKTIKKIPLKNTIECIDISEKINSLLGYVFWQFYELKIEIKKKQCDVLFLPGGIYIGRYRPYFTMAQNLLPFDKTERAAFKYSKTYFRYLLLNILQRYTISKSSGTIFLSKFSLEMIRGHDFSDLRRKDKIIYHGVNEIFFNNNKKYFNLKIKIKPVKLLYVSIINYYKNHISVLDALEILIKKGYNVELDLVGPVYKPAYIKVQNKINSSLILSEKVEFYNEVDNQRLKQFYFNADIFVFASSCETFGMIILEAMAAGLPIACSDRSSMKEIIGNNCEYFDPKDPKSIYVAIENLILDRNKSESLGKSAQKLAYNYSWSDCSYNTFKFLSQTN